MPFVDEMPTRRLTAPGGSDEWFEVRELSWKELDECRRERAKRRLQVVRDMGGEVLKAVAEAERAGEGQAAVVEAARAENERLEAIDSLDPETLVVKSVVGWSYDRAFQASRLSKLDERTFQWLFEAIAELYAPASDGERAEGEGDCEGSSIS